MNKMGKRNIVLNIPHSSINGIFDVKIGGWGCNPYFINDCVRKWTDWFTDMLFNSDNENVKKVVFPYSRFVCDVERLVNDSMGKEGQGIIYTHFGGYKRKTLNGEERNMLMGIYNAHQQKLISSMDKNSVIIDCHSFPSELSDANICIGYNDDWSYDKKIVEGVVKEFEKSGYTVSINRPYSNSITPYTSFEYPSLMIEVNKKVYMDESLCTLNLNQRQWMRWYGCLNRIYEKIIGDE